MSAAHALWQVPSLDAPPPPKPPSIEELQRIEESARAAGFEAGRKEGYAAGNADVRRLVAQIEGVVEALARPFGQLDEDVQAALGHLAVRVAGALMGRAYAADPALLAELVRTALDAVGSGERDVELRLHPDDVHALAPWHGDWQGARLLADPQLARGDVRVHGDGVRIDGRTDARLQAALAAVGHAEGNGA